MGAGLVDLKIERPATREAAESEIWVTGSSRVCSEMWGPRVGTWPHELY